METTDAKTEEQVLEDKIENLIAIGAATAANCISCFEHLYEKAINSGITLAEIKRASDIAGLVKKGAHIALKNSIIELIGIEETHGLTCDRKENKSCCG
jgi:alkylhydroperoxidase/carboxymuconolactone decarboxylase family protein YurZ